MAKATLGGCTLQLDDDEAQFLADLMYWRVAMDCDQAQSIYDALLSAGYQETDFCPDYIAAAMLTDEDENDE